MYSVFDWSESQPDFTILWNVLYNHSKCCISELFNTSYGCKDVIPTIALTILEYKDNSRLYEVLSLPCYPSCNKKSSKRNENFKHEAELKTRSQIRLRSPHFLNPFVFVTLDAKWAFSIWLVSPTRMILISSKINNSNVRITFVKHRKSIEWGGN